MRRGGFDGSNKKKRKIRNFAGCGDALNGFEREEYGIPLDAKMW